MKRVITNTRIRTVLAHLQVKGGVHVHRNGLAKAPDGVAIGHVNGILQEAKALVARAIEQLVFHLLVREVVLAVEDQYAPP